MSDLTDKCILWKCKIDNYIYNFLYEFKYIYDKYIKDPYYDIKNGIKSLKYWLPIIWKDRSWDYYYTYIVMRHSIKRLHDTINKNRRHIGCERDIKRMKICLHLLDRIINDDYHENVFKNHNKKWGDLRMWSEPYSENGKVSILAFHQKNVFTPKDKEQEILEYRRLNKKMNLIMKQDKDLLFKYLYKYSDGWWD